MGKSKTQQRYIYKIKSKRLRICNWDLKLSLDEAFRNDELISISSSQAIRFIDEINGIDVNELEQEILKKRKLIKYKKNEDFSTELRRQIRDLYNNVHELSHIKDYVTIEFSTKSDYKRALLGFFINGVKYKRIVGTTGGIKNKTIVFVSEKVHGKLLDRIKNNAKDIELIPAKLEAYRALAFSSSTPLCNPKGICVVNDWETKFNSDITEVGEDDIGNLYVEEKNNVEMSLEDSDGYGAISPSFSKKWKDILGLDYLPSGYIVRNSYLKGCLFTFDFEEFSNKIAKTNKIKDVWGNWHDVKDIDIIIPTSMLKLWKAYDSIDDYMNSCNINNYIFSVTKVIPKKLDDSRSLNYQFLQSLKISDDELMELLTPTIKSINDAIHGDYRSALAFLKGKNITDETAWGNFQYDFVQAMMIEPKMFNDPFVKSQIHNMIKKRIRDAKTGVIDVEGNFSIISGDIFGFMEFAFGMDKPKGLLKEGEFYSNYWLSKGVNKVTAFRAPMTCHENIKIMNIVESDDMKYWYKYMPNVTIFNAWDCTCHTLNGADKDGDTVFTTNNEIILNSVTPSNPIICMQNSADKVIPTDKQLEESNINGFGEKIGAYTNRATTMEQLKVKFDEKSDEFKELDRRIKLCMHFQQAEIDKIKGIKSPPMPKEWYDYKTNKVLDEDSEAEAKRKKFNISILANKKPKFMAYVYDDLMREYRDFKISSKDICLLRFKCTPEELKLKVNKSIEEIEFLEKMEIQNPVDECNSLMNKICNIFENEFDNKDWGKNDNGFDKSIISPNVKYSSSRMKNIKKLHYDYIERIQNSIKSTNNSENKKVQEEDLAEKRRVMIEMFKKEAYQICPNKYELTTILIEFLYTSKKSKQFVWDTVGDVIIESLLYQNNYSVKYPMLAQYEENYDFEFGFDKYIMREIEVDKEDDECQ